jgi:PAS domain S-box-containing protein
MTNDHEEEPGPLTPLRGACLAGESCRLSALVSPSPGARFADAILESMDEGVAALDAQGRISLFSRRAEEITGLRQGDVLGRRCEDVMCQELCSLAHPDAQDAIAHSAVEVMSRQGRLLHLDVRSQPILAFDRRSQIGRVVLFRDRTAEVELRRELEARAGLDGLVGGSEAMRRVYALVEAIGQNEATVLIEGESGTGKELVARAIHAHSNRAAGPFHAVNCGALPSELLESELFGHVKGAFSGALKDKPGRVELAQGGTLFLDEIGDLPLAMQVKLLRLLQEREFVRVGGTETLRLDARVLAATNVHLERAVKEGRFRGDLYYRLRVIPVRLPPLRERREDIVPLAEHFLRQLAERGGKPKHLSAAAARALISHAWPGNVRELENAVSFAFYTSPSEEIGALDLPPEVGARGTSPVAAPTSTEGEEARVRDALARAGGNKAEAARLLGVNRTTLWRRMSALGIESPESQRSRPVRP